MTTAVRTVANRLVTAAEVENVLPAGCVGYAYAAAGAWWFRLTKDGRVEHAPSAPVTRDPFEIVAFDSNSVVRWTRSSGDLGEQALEHVPQAGMPLRTLLAGHVVQARDGWATLRGRRGTCFEVPLAAQLGQAIVLEQVEEITVDGHGNARVVATHPVRLTAVTDTTAVD